MGMRLLNGVCIYASSCGILHWALLVWVQEANPVLELRIHDEIERGDNDTIKVGDQDVKIHKACSS